MADEVILKDIFNKVLEVHRSDFEVDDDEIKDAISEMHFVYSKNGQNKGATRKPINYNNAAYRCAYIFKYAAVHTAVVQDAVLKFCRHTNILTNMFLQNATINTCSLGGGPGTDVIGVASVLFSLHYRFYSPSFQFTVVDCMSGWKTAFETIIQIAVSGRCGSLEKFLSNQVKCFYICDNLLDAGQETSRAVEAADIITMVKFISAANPKGISAMLKKIFTLMKPGAVVLFIDTACGGFYEKAAQAASHCGLISEHEPYRHMHYEKQIFENYDFGYLSLCSVRVAVQMWKKPFPQPTPQNSSKAQFRNMTPGTSPSRSCYPNPTRQIHKNIFYGDNYWLMSDSLPPRYPQHLRSSQAQLAGSNANFRTSAATKSVTDYVYKLPDEESSLESVLNNNTEFLNGYLRKANQPKVCHVNETKKDDRWCTIL